MAFHNVPPNGFPDLPDVEELEAVVKDVTTLKTSVAGLTEDVEGLNDNKANQITIAPFFNEETAYDPGDLVYYNGLSYRCVNAHEGAWDADDFAATTIAGELDSLKSGLTGLASEIITPSCDCTKLGSNATDGSDAVDVSLGNNNILDYDALYFCTSYYDTGVAANGSMMIPSPMVRSLYNTDSGVPFFSYNDSYNGAIGVRVKLDTVNNTVKFTPQATPAGNYYVVYGVKWRTRS